MINDYYGYSLADDFLDNKLATYVKVKDWEVISDLYQTKWFGYRFMSPGRCYYLFADRYRRAYTSVPGRSKKVHPSMIGVIKNNMLSGLTKSQKTGLWKAMCFADDHGIPYDFYCKTMMTIADRHGWRALPLPTQMYHVSLIWEVKQAWDERLQSGTLVRTEDPHYSLSNYESHEWQDEYMAWLLQQCLNRPNPVYALAKALFQEPQILPSFAASKVSIDRIKDAKSAAIL